MPSIENQYAIFRIKKLRTPQEISRVGNHNDRTGKLPGNVDRDRLHLNRSFTPTDKTLLERVNAKLTGRKFRKDAVKAVEIFCGFSPGCEKKIPIEAWAQSSLDYVKKKFGADNLVSAVLHMDEETPHMHFVIIPVIAEKLAAKRIFGTRKQLHVMQTEYHAAVKKYGLVRGTKGSSRPHLKMNEIYEGTHAGMEIIKRALDSIPEKSLLQTWASYSAQLSENLTAALVPLARAKTAATLAALENESLRMLVNSSELATQTEKDRLRELDLREVAHRLLGYKGIKNGKSTVFEDDARKIVITENSFKDEKSDARGERGAISLARHILDVDFETAVRILAQHFPFESEVVQAEAVRESEVAIRANVENARLELVDTQAKIDFFAKEDVTKIKALSEYLVKIKGIPIAIIKSLINNTKLWANRWGSACFVKMTADESKMGVTIVGTETKSVQSIGPKDTFFTVGDLTNPTDVAIAQNPIDALKIYAASGKPVIAIESVELAEEAYKFLCYKGVSGIILPTKESGFNKSTKSRWREQAEMASLTVTDDPGSQTEKVKADPESPK